MDLGLKDKVIVVTGGGAGIGEAITLACLEEAAKVVIVSRRSANVQAFLDRQTAAGAACDFFEADLEHAGVCAKAIAYVEQRHGRIDGLVNNAGANDGISLADGDEDRFLQSLKRNLVHYYAMAHHALPMLKVSGGSIVNISSKVALTGQGGTSAYAAAKGAQLALTREWAAELLPFGIRVNSVLPAEVMTPLYAHWVATTEDPQATLAKIASRIPLGHRMTEGAEIAATVAFLLSNIKSGHTTGQHLVVDGGYTHLDRSLT
jgi:L-fucose dehydrogenase